MKKDHYVYKITTNDLVYIGVSNDVIKREIAHTKGDDRKGRTMRKYGYTFEVVTDALSEEAAYELETLIVDAKFVAREDTLNKSLGGDGSWGHVNAMYKSGKLIRKGFSKESRDGVKAWKESDEGQKHMKKQGAWLAETHGKKVFQRPGHQLMAARAFWDNIPEGWESPLKGRHFDEDLKKKIYPKLTCPHCSTYGNARTIKQWHINRDCKKMGVTSLNNTGEV